MGAVLLCTVLYPHLTPRVLRLNWPQPRSGGHEMSAVMLQMVMMVMRVESGVDSGNCRSFVTIMNRCSASTVSEMIDWIPIDKQAN